MPQNTFYFCLATTQTHIAHIVFKHRTCLITCWWLTRVDLSLKQKDLPLPSLLTCTCRPPPQGLQLNFNITLVTSPFVTCTKGAYSPPLWDLGGERLLRLYGKAAENATPNDNLCIG